MEVAMVGLGKLGLPVACAMVLKGHTVHGYDKDLDKVKKYKGFVTGLHEPDIDELVGFCVENSKVVGDDSDSAELILHTDLGSAIRKAEIIFIAVPTPSLGDGSFDNNYVIQALKQCCKEILNDPETGYKVFSIISTVLPGTVREEFYPFVEGMLGLGVFNGWGMVYNAQFIAMGSVVEDFLFPEFVLVGGYGDRGRGGPEDRVQQFYEETVDAPILHMTWEEAETVKLIYNTFIGQKIVTANAIMEMCELMSPHADCDVVSDAISIAHKRIISPWYLRGGLGDGGPCHPRDQRALDYWAKKNGMSVNPFEFVGKAREEQSRYMAGVVCDTAMERDLPVCLLGQTFKHDTNLVDDSPAVLLKEQLEEMGFDVTTYDPMLNKVKLHMDEARVYVVCTRHEEFIGMPRFMANGSVIIDPWGFYTDSDIPRGVKLIRIGRKE